MMILTILGSVLALVLFYFIVSALIANGMAMTLRRPINRTPASLGMTFEDISFYSRTDNVLLKGWYISAGQNKTIIVMPGGKQNREDPTTRLLELSVELARRGYNIFVFDRRGCGQSEASGLKNRSILGRDFGGAVDYIRNRNGNGESIILLGISIGAVAAISFTGEEDNVRAIISDSCFTSIPEMTKRVMAEKCKAFIIFQPGAILMGRFLFGLEKESAIDKVPKINCPIFFINGSADKSVPPENAYKLLEASKNQSDEIWIADGAGHSQSYITHPDEYIDRITNFLSKRFN
jgi:pimeloyl-ACP methyl ester carboxylesterase